MKTRDLYITFALFVLGLAIVLPRTWSHVTYTPDALFYEAQEREVRGEGRSAALNYVFATPQAHEVLRSETMQDPPADRVGTPNWVDYSSRFYRRRWTVPAAAAAISGIADHRSLADISLLGITLLAPLLFLLLRWRFAASTAAAGALFCLLLPPVLALANYPGTDSWGLVLLVAAIGAGGLVYERGALWLPLFALSMLVLSFTRDAGVIVLAGTLWLAIKQRSRLMAATTGVGLLATLPAALIFSAPLKENLAYVINGFYPSSDTSWSYIAAGYPGALKKVIDGDLGYPVHTAVPILTFLMGLIAVAAVAMLLFSARASGPLPTLARGTVAGAAATILISINYTGMRLELVFVPAVAVGVALLTESALDPNGAIGRRIPRRSSPLSPAQSG